MSFRIILRSEEASGLNDEFDIEIFPFDVRRVGFVGDVDLFIFDDKSVSL